MYFHNFLSLNLAVKYYSKFLLIRFVLIKIMPFANGRLPRATALEVKQQTKPCIILAVFILEAHNASKRLWAIYSNASFNSQFRSCDDTQEIWSSVFSLKKSACRHIIYGFIHSFK